MSDDNQIDKKNELFLLESTERGLVLRLNVAHEYGTDLTKQQIEDLKYELTLVREKIAVLRKELGLS